MHLLSEYISEFRHPTLWYSKLIASLLAMVFFLLLAAIVVSGYVVYSISIIPPTRDSSIDLASFPGQPEAVSYSTGVDGPRTGWFFPGLKSAPTILLCPGYRATRGELLPLAIALQDHQYNVFLFDFDTRPSAAAYSTLGFREITELRDALAVVAQREDVDRTRFGLWGTNMGAYSALALAESDPRIRAIAVESVYDRPQDMVRLLGVRYGLMPALRGFAEKSFMALNYKERRTPALSDQMSRLAGVPKLFLVASDEPALVDSTHRLFTAAPEPKEEATIAQGNYAGMLGQEKHTYEDRIVSFFLLNLPPEASPETQTPSGHEAGQGLSR